MENKLLVIVDMQNGFMYPNVHKITSNIITLIENFKGQIIFTKFKNSKNSNFVKTLKWTKFINSKDQDIIAELKHYTNDNNIFGHKTYSVLSKKLLDYINTNKINQIYIAGIYTDVCISMLSIQLFDKNIHVKIISDCVTSQKGSDNQIFLDSLERIIGKNNIIKQDEI